MKLNCGLSAEEEIAYKESWHPFFPWWPRRVGSGDCRCFEWIERKGKYYYGMGGGWIFSYRLSEDKPMIGWKRCHYACGCVDEDACVKAPKNTALGSPEKPAGALKPGDEGYDTEKDDIQASMNFSDNWSC